MFITSLGITHSLHTEVSSLTKLLEGNSQFTVPIYQRTYDWQKEQCMQLYEDVKEIGRSGTTTSHFVGAVTYQEDVTMANEDVRRYQIIDGQQRLATMMLILRAMKDRFKHMDGHAVKKIEQLQFNLYEDRHRDAYYKMVLNGEDNRAFEEILDVGKTDLPGNIRANFQRLCKKLSEDGVDFEVMWRGVKRITVVLIRIDSGDNAQEIFESMNSTGLALTQTDLIQNYLLMSHKSGWQKAVFEKYWSPMEDLFKNDRVQFDHFLRTYLIMKTHKTIPKGSIYLEFKKATKESERERWLEDIHAHSLHYHRLKDGSLSKNDRLDVAIQNVHDQDTAVADPLLLKVLADQGGGLIDRGEAAKVFEFIDSYLLRQNVCGMSNNLNKAFASAVAHVDAKEYARSVESNIMGKKGKDKFPRDPTFKEMLKQSRLYESAPVCRYILERLERHREKGGEQVDLSGFEIEHVMPQELSDGWKGVLGPEYAEAHDRYLHTIGNLTLTVRNPELGNRGFESKRRIYADSKIWLTKSLLKYDKWGREQMDMRAEDLARIAVEVWGCPAGYDGAPDERGSEDLEGDHLDGKASDLWNLAKARIGAECGTEFQMKRKYGTFRLVLRGKEHILCWLVAHKHRIDVVYNTKNGEGFMHESEFVKDISDVRHLGGGDFRSELRTEDDVDKAVRLLKTLWEKQSVS